MNIWLSCAYSIFFFYIKWKGWWFIAIRCIQILIYIIIIYNTILTLPFTIIICILYTFIPYYIIIHLISRFYYLINRCQIIYGNCYLISNNVIVPCIKINFLYQHTTQIITIFQFNKKLNKYYVINEIFYFPCFSIFFMPYLFILYRSSRWNILI